MPSWKNGSNFQQCPNYALLISINFEAIFMLVFLKSILIKASSKIGLLESDHNPPQLKPSRQEGHSHYKN